MGCGSILASIVSPDLMDTPGCRHPFYLESTSMRDWEQRWFEGIHKDTAHLCLAAPLLASRKLDTRGHLKVVGMLRDVVHLVWKYCWETRLRLWGMCFVAVGMLLVVEGCVRVKVDES